MMDNCAVCLEPMFVCLGQDGTGGCMASEALFQCDVCHKSIHYRCIDESVATSQEAKCPLCRARFNHPITDALLEDLFTIGQHNIEMLSARSSFMPASFIPSTQIHQEHNFEEWRSDIAQYANELEQADRAYRSELQNCPIQ